MDGRDGREAEVERLAGAVRQGAIRLRDAAIWARDQHRLGSLDGYATQRRATVPPEHAARYREYEQAEVDREILCSTWRMTGVDSLSDRAHSGHDPSHSGHDARARS